MSTGIFVNSYKILFFNNHFMYNKTCFKTTFVDTCWGNFLKNICPHSQSHFIVSSLHITVKCCVQNSCIKACNYQ